MAEIGASRQVWPHAKHQLCWWHQREAVRRRLKGNLPTTPYNAQRAADEHSFIKLAFKLYSCMDPNDSEGSVPEEICEQGTQGKNANTTPLTSEDPNSIKIRIPIARAVCSSQTVQSVQDDVGGPTLASSRPDAQEVVDSADEPTDSNLPGVSTHSDNTIKKLTIRIPAPSTIRDSGPVIDEPEPDEDLTARRAFCPIEHRDTVVEMMERHFCAHPLIPGYSYPSANGIKAWAVKQAYDFCFQHDLANLWAYLWENWYRGGRWELWARSGNPSEIPRLKTMMFIEGQ